MVLRGFIGDGRLLENSLYWKFGFWNILLLIVVINNLMILKEVFMRDVFMVFKVWVIINYN